MASATEKGVSDFSLVQAFTVEGLAAAGVSVATVESAKIAGQPVTWKRGVMDEADVLGPRTEKLLAKYNIGGNLVNGLRLVAPLGSPKSNDAIGGIVGLRGYQAGAQIPGDAAAFKSFAIDRSPFGLRSYLGLQKTPAFSWPMPLLAADDLVQSFQRSNAVQRGFVELSSSAAVNSPSVFADVVEFDGMGFAGPYLAMRFLRAGAPPAKLPPRLAFADLDRRESLVLLPLQGHPPEAMLTEFVYQLSHNSPVDVAAWDTARAFGFRAPPLVMASRAFLDRARLSDIIPDLQARLGRLPTSNLPGVSPDDLWRFNRNAFQDRVPSQPTTASVRDFLADSNRFIWDHESDSAESLLAVARGIATLERDAESYVRPLQLPKRFDWNTLTNALPAPTLEGTLGSSIDIKSILKTLLPKLELPPAAPDQPTPPLPPERYTNVKVFDGERELNSVEPLVAARCYVFDVSIGTTREGVTAEHEDQKPITLVSNSPATIWVVLTDETDSGNKPDGAFGFNDKRYDCFTLPESGKSDGSARFKITPSPKMFARGGRGQIGVRLYHKLNLIDHLELDIYVAATAQAQAADGRRAFDVTFKRPPDDGGIEPPDEASTPRALTISISRQPGTDLYRFAFVAAKDQSDAPGLTAEKVLPESALNNFVARFREILLKTVFGASLKEVVITETQRDDLINDLSELGAEIMLDLFDYASGAGDLFALGTMIREALPETSLIQIALSKDAEDFVFPWQILTLDPTAPAKPENLWGYRFVIEIKRLRDGADMRAAEARQVATTKINYARWNFINEPSHYACLNEAAVKAVNPVVVGTPVIENQAALIAALAGGGGGMIYVYAHGHAAAPSTPAGIAFNNKIRMQIEAIAQNLKVNPLASAQQSSAWTDTYNLMLKTVSNTSVSSLALKNSAEIRLTDLLKQAFRLQDAPIVFLNTCESAQIWNALEGSFAGLFLKRGARAVLGTETTIPIIVADVFGRAVLEQLFAGKPIGEAVKWARRSLLDNQKNPLGLCYSVYGAADAGLFPKPLPQPPQPDQGAIS